MLKQLQPVLDRAHRYVEDITQYQRPEHWTVSLTGDCEDFALWCRQELLSIGIVSDLIFCRTETGEGHLVCSVDGYVLDNRYKWVMCRDDLDCQWISLIERWQAIVR